MERIWTDVRLALRSLSMSPQFTVPTGIVGPNSSSVVLGAVALVAGYLPARRVVAGDPIAALARE